MIRKLLILICALNTVPATAEPFHCPDGEVITNVVSTFKFFDSLEELRGFLSEFMSENHDDTLAYSMCWRNKEDNIAYCDMFVVMPNEVDGEHTISIGHEVMHGVCGDGFHE